MEWHDLLWTSGLCHCIKYTFSITEDINLLFLHFFVRLRTFCAFSFTCFFMLYRHICHGFICFETLEVESVLYICHHVSTNFVFIPVISDVVLLHVIIRCASLYSLWFLLVKLAKLKVLLHMKKPPFFKNYERNESKGYISLIRLPCVGTVKRF